MAVNHAPRKNLTKDEHEFKTTSIVIHCRIKMAGYFSDNFLFSNEWKSMPVCLPPSSFLQCSKKWQVHCHRCRLLNKWRRGCCIVFNEFPSFDLHQLNYERRTWCVILMVSTATEKDTDTSLKIGIWPNLLLRFSVNHLFE